MLCPLASLLHYASLALTKPWIVLARAAEAVFAAVLILVAEWASGIESLPLWQVGVLVFVVRYRQAGEREINAQGYRAFLSGVDIR